MVAAAANSVVPAVECGVEWKVPAGEVRKSLHEDFLAVLHVGVVDGPRVAVRRLVKIGDTIASQVHLRNLLIRPRHRRSHQPCHQPHIDLRAVFHHEPFGNPVLAAKGYASPASAVMAQHELSTFMKDVPASFQLIQVDLVPPTEPLKLRLHVFLVLEPVEIHPAVCQKAPAARLAITNTGIFKPARSIEIDSVDVVRSKLSSHLANALTVRFAGRAGTLHLVPTIVVKSAIDRKSTR